MLQWLPESISTFGYKIDHVIQFIYLIVGVWFVAVQAILFAFLFKYRRGANVKPAYALGNTFKSLLWITVPVVAVFGFDVAIEAMQTPVWDEIKIERPANPDETIGVVGQQFFWEFHYAGVDGKVGTADDIKSMSDFYVPVNKKILVQLESTDVIHSFWLPNLRLKQDVVPGRRISAWFEANKTGTYEIGCAELCGGGHGNMRGMLHVVSQEEYRSQLEKLAAQGSEEIY